MKIFRMVEPGETEVETIIGDTKRQNDYVILRPIPEPTWRKISDGPPVTYPCWVTDGKEVAIAYTSYRASNPTPAAWNKLARWDETVTHWMPVETEPQPPLTEEAIAFEKWYDTHWRPCSSGSIQEAHKAWLTVLAFAKGQR